MNAEKYNEKDIEILEEGFSVQGTFFDKKKIAELLNGYARCTSVFKI